MASAGEYSRRDANFRSVDSRPGQLAVHVSTLRAPALLLTFAILSAIQIAAFELGWLDELFPARDYVFGPYMGMHALAVRAFILSFYISFAIFASGTAKARAMMAFDLVLRFLVICALLDLGSTALLGLIGEPYPLSVIQVIAGLLGFGIFAFIMLERGTMPEPVFVRIDRHHNYRSLFRIAATGSVAMVISAWAGFHNVALLNDLRELSLLGGIGPGVVLFLTVFFAQLYVIAAVQRRILARRDFAAPISVIVPAHNERYIIEETIRYIDRAAAEYSAPVQLIIMDNASTDGTGDHARAAIAACSALEGRVVEVPRPGKAHALNAGAAIASHEFIVRIDADTLVRGDTFRLAMQNFANAETGAVGGIPLPPGGALFDGGRLVEVLLKHGYYSPALSAITGLVGIPGMFVIYRRSALQRAGSFPAGMNGEDTDISLRIAELGYHSLVDERVRYVSEVPTSFAHLREQRLRWFRSVYHVSARASSLIVSRRITIRGKLILPYMLLNNARRAMMVPLLVFGLLEAIFSHNTSYPLDWHAVLAVLLGAPLLNAVLAIVLSKEPRAFLSLPPYVFFRTLRAWYTLESALTIPINTHRTRVTLPDTGHALAFATPSLAPLGDSSAEEVMPQPVPSPNIPPQETP